MEGPQGSVCSRYRVHGRRKKRLVRERSMSEDWWVWVKRERWSKQGRPQAGLGEPHSGWVIFWVDSSSHPDGSLWPAARSGSLSMKRSSNFGIWKCYLSLVCCSQRYWKYSIHLSNPGTQKGFRSVRWIGSGRPLAPALHASGYWID